MKEMAKGKLEQLGECEKVVFFNSQGLSNVEI